MSTPVTDALEAIDAKVEVPDRLKEAREEVAALRSGVETGQLNESPESLHERLLAAGQALDRVEEILADLGLLKARTAQAVEEAQAVADDAYTEAASKGTMQIAEFSSGKERDATYSLATMNHRIKLRQLRRLDSEVKATYDYVHTKYWGISNSRRALDSRIRLLVLESTISGL